MSPEIKQIGGNCPCCEEPIAKGSHMYLVNSEGGYGFPEFWACETCMRDAEEGSKLADLRDGIYAQYFRGFDAC